MKVLMASGQFYPTVGGTEKQALGLSKALAAAGIEVSVLTQKIAGSPVNETVSGIEVARGIRTLRFGFLYGATYLLSSLFFFIRHRRRYDIIHCHHLYLCAAAAVVTARLFSKKVAVKIACTGAYSDIACLRNMRGGSLLLWIAKKADLFFATSGDAVSELLAIGVDERKISKIPNFVDTARFRPASPLEKQELRNRLGLPASEPIVVFSGRFTRQKGTGYLLEAWRMAKEKGLSGRLVMLGGGVLEGEIRGKLASAGLSGSVTLAGELGDVRDFLRAADIFVLPSISEGLSNALLEAMGCGLACIATGIGGNTDLIEHGTDGLLVPPADPAGICAALETLLSGPAKALVLGGRAAMKIKDRYSLEKITAEYAEIYKRL